MAMYGTGSVSQRILAGCNLPPQHMTPVGFLDVSYAIEAPEWIPAGISDEHVPREEGA